MFDGYMLSQYVPFIEPGLLLLGLVGLIVVALLKELRPSWQRWRASRNGFEDSQQSSYVRGYAARLSSPRRAQRVGAVASMGCMNDRTAVPALIRAIERYKEDGPFLEQVVKVLGEMGDDRALPVLRTLTNGRHHSLMQAAREAIGMIEPKSVLLRGSSAPEAQKNSLLRPAGGGRNGDSERLLRAELRD